MAGCDNLTKREIGTGVGAVAGVVVGSMFGSGSGRAVAMAIGGAAGGLAGAAIGAELDKQDKLKAYRAAYGAANSDTAEPVHWVSDTHRDVGGYAQPAGPRRRGRRWAAVPRRAQRLCPRGQGKGPDQPVLFPGRQMGRRVGIALLLFVLSVPGAQGAALRMLDSGSFRTLVVAGRLEAGDENRVAGAIDAANGVREVWFNSDGGVA